MSFYFPNLIKLIISVCLFFSSFNSISGQKTENWEENFSACKAKVKKLKKENEKLNDTIIQLNARLRKLELDCQKSNSSSNNTDSQNTASNIHQNPQNDYVEAIQKLKTEIQDQFSKKPPFLPKIFNLFGKQFYTYSVDLRKENKLKVKMYWKDGAGGKYYNFDNIKRQNPDKFIFATNGGMYNPKLEPEGLLVEEGKEKRPLKSQKTGKGNFYLQPNGIFLIDYSGKAYVVKTDEYHLLDSTRYATQSGPLLVYEGKINTTFTQDSKNLRIRSGVGMIDDNRVVFILSKNPVNFYEFARVFKDVFNCNDALFLDGEVSKMYCPELGLKNTRIGNFATIIGIAKE